MGISARNVIMIKSEYHRVQKQGGNNKNDFNNYSCLLKIQIISYPPFPIPNPLRPPHLIPYRPRATHRYNPFQLLVNAPPPTANHRHPPLPTATHPFPRHLRHSAGADFRSLRLSRDLFRPRGATPAFLRRDDGRSDRKRSLRQAALDQRLSLTRLLRSQQRRIHFRRSVAGER